jgi:hypothetical protein
LSSLKSSLQYAAGNRSNRIASIWPSLTHAPPSSSRASRVRMGADGTLPRPKWTLGAM